MIDRSFIKIISLAVVVAMAVSAAPLFVSDGSDAEMTVKDGYGNEFTFSDEPSHIITIGSGITATCIQLGAIDKILVADSYSKGNTNQVFDVLREYVNAGKIAANGNIYSSGKAALKTDIVDAADTEHGGKFDKETDPVFITGGNSYINPIIEDLKALGFQKVMAWNDITEYNEIADFVSTVSKIIDGTESDKVAQMKHVSEVISDGVKDKTKREAFYVTYSGSVFKVGNTKSLANSMIYAAGGESITTNPDISTSTYEANVTTLVEQHPDAVIFLDSSIHANAANKEAFLNAIEGGSGKTIVEMNSLWNNYSIDSMNGVWTMACAMYPDTFEGDVPTVDDDSKDNTVLYIGIGAAAAAVILVAGVLFLRKH